jgi:hypothetical protein
LLESVGRISKALGACEAERLLGDDQVWFKDAETVIPGVNSFTDQSRNLALAGARRYVTVGLWVVILDVKVFHMRKKP